MCATAKLSTLGTYFGALLVFHVTTIAAYSLYLLYFMQRAGHRTECCTRGLNKESPVVKQTDRAFELFAQNGSGVPEHIVTPPPLPPRTPETVLTKTSLKTPEKVSTKTTASPAVKKAIESLTWAGAPLRRGHPQWQTLDSEMSAFVYSAHLDDIDFPPLVRIVGFALAREMPYRTVTCIFHYDKGDEKLQRERRNESRVSGTLYRNRDGNMRRYIGAFVDCPLAANMTSLPYAVSVFKPGDREDNNYMILHNSHSPQWTEVHRQKANYSDMFDNHPGADGKYTPEEMTRKRGEDTWKWNITQCFPAIQKRYNKHTELAEMVSFSLAFGVQHFVFYVQSAGPNVVRLLKVLEDSGLAEVHPWNVNMASNVLYYAGQPPAIQECLYRNLWSSRYVLFGDMDELFVPRTQLSLMALLQSWHEKNPKCASFMFLQSGYGREGVQLPPPQVDPLHLASKYKMKMITRVLRNNKFLGPSFRSKVAGDPHKIKRGGIHAIRVARTGFVSCTMAQKEGRLQHYRKLGETVSPSNDTYLWQVAPDALHTFQDLLGKFSHTVIERYP